MQIIKFQMIKFCDAMYLQRIIKIITYFSYLYAATVVQVLPPKFPMSIISVTTFRSDKGCINRLLPHMRQIMFYYSFNVIIFR